MYKQKGFLPYIFVVFFNSFIDLGHKILLQNTVYNTTTSPTFTILSAILNSLILLPYILLFTPSGFISDRFSKAVVLRYTAASEIPMTLLTTLFYFLGYFWAAFSCTLLLAIQSTINSPAKYGYIKEMFGPDKIAKANAWVQTTVIVSILSGTFAFTFFYSWLVADKLASIGHNKSLLITHLYPLGFLLVALAITETLLTLRLHKKPAADPDSHYKLKDDLRLKYANSYLSGMTRNPIVFTCIIGLSIFWAVNQVLLAAYGAYLKEYVTDATAMFAQGYVPALAGLGILLGASYAGRVSRGYIETGIIPVAAWGLTLCLICLPFFTLKPLILLLILVYGCFGGMLVVPLNALIQFHAKNKNLGKILAANNFIQNIFMVSFLALTVITTMMGIGSRTLLISLFAVALGGTLYAFKRLPQALMRFVVYFILSKVYRITVKGLNELPASGGTLLIGNHISYLDWAILQIASPRPIRFVMERSIYEKWYLHWLLKRLNMIPISRGASRSAIASVREALLNGNLVAIFPEGYLSRNGQLGEFYPGFEKMVEDTDAVIIPFYLQGLWGTVTSYASEHYKERTRKQNKPIYMHIGKPLDRNINAAQLKQAVTALSTKAWADSAKDLQPIAYEWLKTAKSANKAFCLADTTGLSLTHDKLIASVFHLSRNLARPLQGQQNIGLMLPTLGAGSIANLSVLCHGKTLVNLNYTAGTMPLKHAIASAAIKTVVTSKHFVKRLKSKGCDFEEITQNVNVVYLEDIRKRSSKIGFVLHYFITRFFPLAILQHIMIDRHENTDVAAILFSSGSEGTPKGIELTHKNMLINAKQIACVFHIEENDVILNYLPLFHAFGLTVSTIMPLIEGVPFVLHADPTDAVNIGKLAYRYRATVMCATATFLGLYTRNKRLKAPMFTTLRLVIAGAEKLNPKIREGFQEKFNVLVYECYGATETSPVASSNLPDALNLDDWHLHVAHKDGTVGLPLPGTAFSIVDPVTLEKLPSGESGLILIGGPQVMKGYLNNPLKSNDVLFKDNGIVWYKTGDKGFLDEQGFLTIVDRYSRFAKVAGEMISLAAVEEAALTVIHLTHPESDIMAVNIPDEKKGEKIILLFDAEIEANELKQALISAGIDPLLVPGDLIHVEELPRLGSGKKDYNQAKKIVIEGSR